MVKYDLPVAVLSRIKAASPNSGLHEFLLKVHWAGFEDIDRFYRP